MKKLFALLFLTFFFFITHAQTGIRDKEVFVRSIFAAVQENDSAAFMKLFPNKEGFVRLTDEYFNTIKDTAERRKEKEFFFKEPLNDSTFNEMFAGVFTAVRSVQESAKQLKIDLSKVTMTGWDEQNNGEKFLDSLRSFGGYIFFTNSLKDYTLIFGDVVWCETDQCYYGVSLKGITEKGKEAEAELDVNKMIKNALESNKVSEPPPAKKRTTVKKAPSSPAKKTTIKH